MAEDTWEKSLEALKARKKEAEDKAEAEKEAAKLKQEQEDKQNQGLQAFLTVNGYVEGQDKLVKTGTKTEIWRCVAVLEAK
jgi:regulator of protease activity HflC (stomatin/prohibitin superfamily)